MPIILQCKIHSTYTIHISWKTHFVLLNFVIILFNSTEIVINVLSVNFCVWVENRKVPMHEMKNTIKLLLLFFITNWKLYFKTWISIFYDFLLGTNNDGVNRLYLI